MKKITVVWLCVLLMISFAIAVMAMSEDVDGKSIVRNGTIYRASNPFRINSNADFATSPKVAGGFGDLI